MTDLGIVIVSWNVREQLAVCLESLSRTRSAHAERAARIIVVDNASTDGSAEMVRDRFPLVQLVASDKNRGFAGGNNLGMRAWGLDVEQEAKSEKWADGNAPRYILLLNPDTAVRGNALGTMIHFMDATPQAGVCGARLIYGDGSFQHSAFGFPGLWQIALDAPSVHPRLRDSRLNGRYSRSLYASGRPFEVDHPLGAAMMVRAEVIHQVGPMDEGFHMYCEEIDWCWRIKKAGWKIYCVPPAEIVHYGGQSTKQVRAEMIVALWASRLRLYQRYYPAWKLAAAKWLVHRKMRAELRRADTGLARGSMDGATHTELTRAYRRVIEFYAHDNYQL
jgi:GT2 family glycosyltransferase